MNTEVHCDSFVRKRALSGSAWLQEGLTRLQ